MNKSILIILDGYGEGNKYEFNAVDNANSPFLKGLKQLPYSLLKTDSEAVGLFKNNLGGSEVGHMTIGSGRVIPSTAKQISDDILDKTFNNNLVLTKELEKISKNAGDLHLVGLCSDKNIHSNINHLFSIIDLAKNIVKNIFIHFITDGRDTGPYDSLKYLKLTNNKIKDIKNCSILSISGRFFGMDRENHTDRVDKALKAMFKSDNKIKLNEVDDYLKSFHKKGINDQFIEPVHIDNKNYNKLTKKDCIFFFNFREDRLRQIVKSCEKFGCDLLTMAEVGNTKAKSLYKTKPVKNTLCEYLSNKGLKICKISESTKYAHVTYFFNGGIEEPFKNENRVHIPSLNVNDFSKTPKMRSKEITNEVLKALKINYDLIVVNYSNPDMVGHTGDYVATKKAIEFLDKCVKKVVGKAQKFDYKVMITADHGNAEIMKYDNGEPHTAHTLNRVFCCVVGNKGMKKFGELKDIAPTILDLMGVENCKDFTGTTLLN